VKERRKLGPTDFMRMNLPQELWCAKVQNVPEAIRADITSYLVQIGENVSRGTGLFLAGKAGVGKSGIAALVAKEARIQGYTAFFITVWEFREAVRARLMFDDELSVFDRCRDVAVLVLDDLALPDVKEAYTGGRFLEGLIAHRGSRHRITVITTRLSNEALTTDADSLNQTIKTYMVRRNVAGPDLRELKNP